MHATKAVAPAAPHEEEPALRLLAELSKNRRLHRSGGVVGAPGLSQMQVSILLTLVHRGEQRLTALAEKLDVDLSVVSRQAMELTEHKLISRRADPIDGRAVLFQLTQAGRVRINEIGRLRAEWVRRVLADYGEDRMNEASEVLAALNAAWPSDST